MGIESINIFDIAIILLVILLSMTLHEVMHGYVAYLLGDDTAKLQGRLTLNPIKHIDPFLTIILPVLLAVSGAPIFGGAKPVPFNPARVKYDEWGSALVALAGPVTNFLIAFTLFGLWAALGAEYNSVLGGVLWQAVLINLGFFIFNMIPFPPLDGSRVLYALAPEFVRRGMEAIEQYGVVFVFVIVFFASSAIGAFMLSAMKLFIIIFSAIFGIA